MFLGVLDMSLRPLIDWYRCRALNRSFKKVDLTHHHLYVWRVSFPTLGSGLPSGSRPDVHARVPSTRAAACLGCCSLCLPHLLYDLHLFVIGPDEASY